MGYLLQGLFGEKSLTKVVGIFDSEAAARAAAVSLAEAARLAPDQVRTLSPHDEHGQRDKLLGRKMEPEGRGIVRTLVRAHLVLGALGAAAGVALYAALRASGQPAILASPRLSLAAIVGLACVFGLLLGGLLSLRPDHVKLITDIRTALTAGSWAVVAHPVDATQTQAAVDHFASTGARVLRSL